MYQSSETIPTLDLFPMHLIRKDSPWLALEQLIPWRKLEVLLKDLFSSSDRGRKSIPVRHVLGALIIQNKMNLTDRDTIDMISDMPALQYFLGLPTYEPIELFDFTLLCKYRQLLGIDLSQEMIEELLKFNGVNLEPETGKTHRGSLSIDATVAPVNITYPTDLKLLNVAREQSEKLIDDLYKKSALSSKPRTKRKKARADYLLYAKAKNLSRNKRFTANRMQLQYIDRNVKTIEKYANEGVFVLDDSQTEVIETIKQIYEQQHHMWETKTNRVDDRVVSFSQPHVRGIVRGKAGTKIEFGPKIAASKVNGYIILDKISFPNFNESQTLMEIIGKYKEKYGVYPEVVRADKIYQTRDNKTYCKSLGIRLSGPKLGRKPKDEEILKADREVQLQDLRKRQEIEGVFGVAKTKYGLEKLMTKLPESQIASIGLIFFVMNLVRILDKVSFYAEIEVLVLSITDNEMCYVFEDE
ncbi:MAG: IS5 family transposase [Verrucomicrobiae bacterium]|nr:IS5 family transposase [Verrucomicrobiae bacterium]